MSCPEKNVGILESNSFNMNNLDKLDEGLRSMVARREVLGPCYRLFLSEASSFSARKRYAPVRC